MKDHKNLRFKQSRVRGLAEFEASATVECLRCWDSIEGSGVDKEEAIRDLIIQLESNSWHLVDKLVDNEAEISYTGIICNNCFEELTKDN